MILTESVKSSFETVLKTEAQIDLLKKQVDEARENIRKFLIENNETQLKQDGYYANISESTRNTLQAKEVEKLLGYKIPDNCYKSTTYSRLTIKRMELV